MIENMFVKPPPYGSISNWLGPIMVQRLLNFAQAQRDSFVPTGIGHAENAKVDVNIRRSSRVKDLGDLKKELRAKVREVLPEMFRRLGTDVFDPGRLEVEMVAHGHGAFFTEHRDTAIEDQKLVVRRVISAVYYFHRLPKSFSGGVLQIYPLAGREKSNNFIEIEPINDTLVFFPSWFPHEVLPVVCPSGEFEDSRFAINCWVYA
jgi:SM-20-related protein